MKKDKMAYIYGLVDPVSKQVRYVGWTCRDIKSRLWDHINEATKCRRNTHKLSWIRSLLRQSLAPEVILLEQVGIDLWAETEKKWIKDFKTQGFGLTNLTDGGQGTFGWSPSEKMREKLRQINLGKKHTEESRLKMSLVQKGKPKEKAKLRTPEENAIVSQNISKGKKGKKLNLTPEQKKENSRRMWESRRANGKGKGGYTHTKKRSKESYAQTWESRRKNGTDKASAETKKKLSDYNKKYRTGVNHPRYGTVYPPNPHSPETIQKITLTKRHKAMNQKQIKLYKTLYPNSYGDLLNIVNY